jgi:hypothetical protein
MGLAGARTDVFSATATRMSACNAFSSILFVVFDRPPAWRGDEAHLD